MDANGLRFWLLADGRHFPTMSHAGWDAQCRVLRLASERSLEPPLPPKPPLSPPDPLADALSAVERVPRAIDALECVARWDAQRGSVLVKSALPDDAELMHLEETPRDLCVAPDEVLYIALPGKVRMHDLRGRWADVDVMLADFEPWRMAPAAEGGVWVMERVSGRLARLTGRPMRTQTPQSDDYDPQVFRPTPENGCSPQMQLVASPKLEAAESPQALAGGPDGAMCVLSWRDKKKGTAWVRRWLTANACLSAPLQLQGAEYAYAVTWVAPERIAVRVPRRRDAPAFDLSTAADSVVLPLGDVYPLSDAAREAPFTNGIAQPPQYPSGERGAEPLYPLSLNNLARRGEALNFAQTTEGLVAWLIDSKDNTTVWHRLYAEAGIPARSGFVVWLAATNDPQPPASDDLASWHAHGFGRDIAALDDLMDAPQLPHAVWEHEPSELAGHPGLLRGELQPGRRGLFSVLVQNTRRRVRNLVGRYLWVRIVMHGDGRVTPEIAALRVWGSRFSYADRYLPRLYRESLFGDAGTVPGERVAQIEATHAAALDRGGTPRAALGERLKEVNVPTGPAATIVVERAKESWLLRDGSSAWRLRLELDPAVRQDPLHPVEVVALYRPSATPADFTARLLANFEGVLTQIEDRVAAAHLLSDPAVTGDEHLDWLGSWIGIAFDNALPAERRRDWLRAAPDLARWHGTRRGLRLALDIATGGGVRNGSIVVVEDFRLRRILATLLGVDLADERDPLLPGLQQSGNSIVGDTLFVGDRERVELLALFDESVGSEAEDAAVLGFYEQLAYRATVLVHREVQSQDFTLIRRIAQLEAPAHVEIKVAPATWPLLVGIASLVGVDTYLGPPRLPRPVQVERSALGMGDFLIGPAALDPRLSGSPGAVPVRMPPPVADAGPDIVVPFGSSLRLDASGSRAAPGLRISEYRWRLIAAGIS